jgi:hypothetical protein
LYAWQTEESGRVKSNLLTGSVLPESRARPILPPNKAVAEGFNPMGDSDSQPCVKDAYRLTGTQLTAIESQLVDLLEQAPGRSALATVLLPTDNPLSDFVRTYEANVFAAEDYDFFAGMKPYERDSLFLVTVDLENKVVAHVKRIVRARGEQIGIQGLGLTGIEVVDDRLTATDEKERISSRAIMEFHKILDIKRCFNLTSNIQTGRCQPTWDKPYSLISYKAVFKATRVLGIDFIFAYMNRLAVRSLGRVGVEFDKLAGKEFHLPMPGEPGRYDLNYEAVCIPGTRHNLEAFTKEDPERPFTRLVAGLDVPLYQLDGVDVSLSTLCAVAPAR